MSGMVLTLVEPVGADVGGGQGAAAGVDLGRIIHKAILARRFAEVHKQTVRQCVRAARAAGQRGNRVLAAALLRDARAEHAEAQACARVARALERQAEEMGRAAGVYRATGRASAPATSEGMPAIDAHAVSGAAASVGSPAIRKTLGGSE